MKKQMWVVMKMEKWESLVVLGNTNLKALDGYVGFLPVFHSKKIAIEYSGSVQYVFEIQQVP